MVSFNGTGLTGDGLRILDTAANDGSPWGVWQYMVQAQVPPELHCLDQGRRQRVMGVSKHPLSCGLVQFFTFH